LQEKGIATIMDKAYRSPASDGAIIAPLIKRFFEFEKGLDSKINSDCKKYLELLSKDSVQGYIPRFHLGSIINAPNKAGGLLITLKIHLHKEKCIKCDRCIEQCPQTAFSKDENGYPLFIISKCEECYRCIHHCPKGALSLFKRKSPLKRFNYENII
jgi:ferredoxin